MKKMRFSKKQNDVTIATPEDGVTDVIVLQNEKEINKIDEQSGEETIFYEYDGNIFRTYKTITEDDVLNEIDYYLYYEGDKKPTDEMVEYANTVIDEYTEQLIEEGLI